MPWAVIEHIDDETAEETTHVVPFVRLANDFVTREEAEAFEKERDRAGDSVTDPDGTIVGAHRGHVLSANCACRPRRDENDPWMWIHNAAN